MKKSEIIALDNYLSDYPETMSFDVIIGTLYRKGYIEGIVPKEFFADFHPPFMADCIQTLQRSIKKAFEK